MLKIRRDFQQLQCCYLDDDDDNDDDENENRNTNEKSASLKTTIANSKKVISVKIKKKRSERAMKKRHSMGKMAKPNMKAAALEAASNKRNSSIRKIHIRIEENIHIIATNHCQHRHTNDDFVKGREKIFLRDEGCGDDFNIDYNNEKITENIINQDQKIIFPKKHQLIEIIIILGIRMIKEILM